MKGKAIGKKRPATNSAERPSKKRKALTSTSNGKQQDKKGTQSKNKGKGRAYERVVVPIPEVEGGSDSEIDEEDVEFFREHQGTDGFLRHLDANGIARSKRETERLHKLSKPPRPITKEDDSLSINSDNIDDLSASEFEEEEIKSGEDDEATLSDSSLLDSDDEQAYEQEGRGLRNSKDAKHSKGPERLPIKLASGQIQKRGNLSALLQEVYTDDSEDELDQAQVEESRSNVEDVATGARFGRAAVIDVVGKTSRKERVQAAKEQLADICQEIIADPENSIGLLRRLHTFSLPSITSPSHPEPVGNDIIIRKLALLSQLAVFKDIIPGYRIRPLTDKEKSEKVSQMVMRTREFEQGLVGTYQSYLRVLENEVKNNTELAPVALQSMCKLLTDVTHFNFRVNLMSAIVARLSKKSWDELSDLCLQSFITVFKNDLTGQASLEVVRLLNRMVKERHFRIHPKVLSCLLHLRLKSELHVRSSDIVADREDKENDQTKGKGRGKEKVHLSKKAKKALKERKEIEKEMQEAEAEVDREERAKTHTETLKLLFVLYFRILKYPSPTPLLPAALDGLSRFAHLVNIDFFKDLMNVLKGLIGGEVEPSIDPSASADIEDHVVPEGEHLRHRLLCIVTAFELLSGQGEALNIDLSEFVTHLYSIVLELAVSLDIEQGSESPTASSRRLTSVASASDLLFRALGLVFSPRTSQSNSPPWRTAAFSKRLLICALSWPQDTALRSLDFVRSVLAKEPALDALLSTEDRRADGVYRAELNDPQLCNPFGTTLWELWLLTKNHCSARVREEAEKLLRFTRS